MKQRTYMSMVVLLQLLNVFQHAVTQNIRIHPNPMIQQHEPSIITHPSDPNIVLVIANAASSTGVSAGWYHTTDGGIWTGRDTMSTHSNLSLGMVDPAVGIDLDGNIYAAGLYGQVPGIALDVYVARSSDNGANWTQTTITTPINADRTHMTIDVNPASPHRNYLYIAYTEYNMSRKPIRFIRSTDRGQNFSDPLTVSGSIGSLQSFGVNLAVSPDSVLYATWGGFDAPFPGPLRLGFTKSSNGGISWETATSIRTVGGIGPVLNKGGNEIFAYSGPSMAVDRSSGQRRGWIYIVYEDNNPTTPDIFLVRSTNGGTTWSDPRKVNQDNSGNDQWNPYLSVDPSTGNLFIVYYDSRNFPANDSAQVFISASLDGGETFRDILVSDGPFLPAPLGGIAPPRYMGGYIGITALQGVVWPCWNDNRSGAHQVYVARIADSVLSSVKEIAEATIPAFFKLGQNFPNPFNPSTEIQFSLPKKAHATLVIFDVLGREVTTLVSEELSAGSYSTLWNASAFPSGAYFYRLRAGDFVETKKLLLLR